MAEAATANIRHLADVRGASSAKIGAVAPDPLERLPQGTVTFLLTDVVGSSRLWEIDPPAASVALARREELLRDTTVRHGGVLPVEQGEGDSSVSAFARASDAAECAVDMQRVLAAEGWPAGVEVRVRIALHTGEAEVRDGTYQGAVLNRCSRLRSLGHGGQILLSQATYEVLIDGLAEGSALRDLGVYSLRDLARPEHVWQLCHPELSDAFPPLRSLDAVANNLPVQLTSFVGREAEIEAVRALLSEHRLVTLTGAGGSGKTRLAIQLATAVADGYPDGIRWVDLAPLADPSLVPAAVAAVLGVPESPVEPITDTVVRHLAPRRCLIGLDNCEHLIESCAALAARLTHACPDVTLLATSREALRVEGETAWPVPPLHLPDGSETLDECEAVRLFVDRVRSAQPRFSLTPDNVPAVAEICTRLDGIPLAIELAAARVRVLSVEQIAGGLADRFHLLTGGARTALPRQRTLESSVDWSHDLLDDTERVVFRRLAVFAGTFTIDAAEEVCAGEGVLGEQVLDLLGRLVDQSLVQVADEAGAQTRYRLLETIRDYARHKLTDAGEAEATRDRHLDHCVWFAERAADGLQGPDLFGWLQRVDAELDNLRAALDWSPHSGDPDRGAHLVGRLSLYWFARSELGIGRARLQATLDHASPEGRERAGALGALCFVYYRAGDMATAGRLGDEGIAIARRLDDPSLLGHALHWRAWVRYWGDADRFAAWADFEEAAALLLDTDDGAYRPLNLAILAWTLTDTSEARRARGLLDDALALTAASPSPHARAYCLIVLGYVELTEGCLEEAAAHLGDALALAEQIGDHYADVLARLNATSVDVFGGRYRAARERSERGLATALEHRSPNAEAFIRISLGTVDYAEGHLDAAAAQLEASADFLALHVPAVLVFARNIQTEVALARSRFPEARRYAEEALSLARQGDMCWVVESALASQARLARVDGDPHAAEDLCHDALDLACPLGHRPAMCDALEILAGAVADQDRFEEAARLFGAAQALRDGLGYVRFPVLEPSHDADVAVVREALVSEDFDQAWSEGGKLSLDEAVVYAQRGRGRRKRPTHGWDSLTPTEVQVVELVAQGLTNPQIGERLFISRRTVQTHLAHAFAKLGVSTRAEVAVVAAERRTAIN
jgi:predicted ATPase/class 3 adenylate cyclase/DNA-binding CsgD family transcriptional regulator